ncbi:hypothetical protein T484DRAFT_1814934, partial [Baffinella frigidus]
EKKNAPTEEEIETHRQMVILIGKHIEECEALEKKRYQSRLGGQRGAKGMAGAQEVRRTAVDTGLAPIEVDVEMAAGLQQLNRNDEILDDQLVDVEMAAGLQQLNRNDEILDDQLDVIAKGVQRLKGIATDQSNELDVIAKGVQRLKGIAAEQSNEVKLQSVMIDQISDNMDKATDHLNDANIRLKETLAKAGGATSILVKGSVG